MPFIYRTVACATYAGIVPAVEQFCRDTGWTIVSGAGTQDVIASSSGEPPFRFTKLFIRVATDAFNFYWRIQDDLAGTHSTSWNLYAKQVGAFTLRICGDKNAIFYTFDPIALYPLAIYMGIGNSFNLSYPDETYIMVCGWKMNGVTGFRVLRNYDGTWDVLCSHSAIWGIPGTSYPSIRDRFDNTLSVFGTWIYHSASSHIIGELYHVSFWFNNACANVNDTLTTTQPGSVASTDWLVVTDNTVRYAMRTGGVAPTGFDIEPSPTVAYPVYARTNVEFVNAVRTVLASLGWTETDYSGVSGITPDWIFHSVGETGAESIHCRLNYTPVWGSSAAIYVVDWVAGAIAHQNGGIITGIGMPNMPMKIGIAANKDCFMFWTEYVYDSNNVCWAGKVRTLAPGLWTGNTTYSMAAYINQGGANFLHYPLRDHDGTWVAVARTQTDAGDWAIPTPQLLDTESIPIMPVVCRSLAGEIYGIMTYLYRAHNVAVPNGLTPGDEIRYGNKRYKYFRYNNVQLQPYFVRIK